MKYRDLNMYNLFIDRKNYEMRITKVNNRARHLMIDYTEDVQYYNEFYFVCTDKNKLKEKANEIKQEWQNKIEVDLEKVKNIKI